MLLEQARKYNLIKVIPNFILELNEIIIGKQVSEKILICLKAAAKAWKIQ